ncbi:MAG: type I methionyl aminopeptidase [Phycisphaerales bacterium]|nr:type I methionyl aminopeptidase [Phycisphaerales bacterium]
MRRAGRLVYDVLDSVARQAVPGVTTGALNAGAERMISDAGATPLFKGVVNNQASFPFPAALCISVNDEVVHGVPGERLLCDGDIVSLDCGVRLNGYCGDSARTVAVGTAAPDVLRLLEVTEATLSLAIREIRAGRMWSEVALQMQRLVEAAGFSVVRDFVGHGIGQDMHEDPKVPNYCDRKQLRSDFRLQKGMTLAIEPMVTMGSHAVEYTGPGRWTVVTRDGKYAAHFEHTVVVTETGSEVLTAGG